MTAAGIMSSGFYASGEGKTRADVYLLGGPFRIVSGRWCMCVGGTPSQRSGYRQDESEALLLCVLSAGTLTFAKENTAFKSQAGS